MSATAPESNRPAAPDPTRPASALDVRIHFTPSLPLIRLAGELDISSLHLLTDALHAITAATGPPDVVVIDLAGVTFCDVAGLRTLEQCGLALEMDGRQLVLHSPPRAVTRLMAVTRIGQGLPVRR